MGQFAQKAGTKGSLKWIQRLINRKPSLLEGELRRLGYVGKGVTFTWTSPLEAKQYAEYRDAAFLKAIGKPRLAHGLAMLWPRRGPQWDALGYLRDGTPLLVEAKAHIPEVLSHMGARSQSSIDQIRAAFQQTKKALGVKSPNPWETPFYQYANRVAHLHFLKNVCSTEALLVFVDFVGDSQVNGPKTPEEWHGATDLIHAYLGIRQNPVLKSIAHVCVDVKQVP